MAVNKIIYGGETLIDLTEDTVTPETLVKGTTAHDKSGAPIVGTYEGGGGGGNDDLSDMLTNKMTALDSNVTSVRQYAFRGATALVSINLPKATSIATNAFYGCTKLTSVNVPSMKSIADNAFN